MDIEVKLDGEETICRRIYDVLPARRFWAASTVALLTQNRLANAFSSP